MSSMLESGLYVLIYKDFLEAKDYLSVATVTVGISVIFFS